MKLQELHLKVGIGLRQPEVNLVMTVYEMQENNEQ